MTKKIIYIFTFTALLFVIASCNSKSDFEFKNLNVDFANAEALGIKLIDESNLGSYSENTIKLSGQKLEVYSEIRNTQLVKIDSEGKINLVEYKDNEGNVVEIPYYLYYFEIVGDFTYLMYYQSLQDLVTLNDAILNSHQWGLQNSKLIDFFFYDHIGTLNTIKKIAVHNESGKVFDYTEIFNNIINAGETYINSFFTNEKGQFFSSFTSWDSTCTYVVTYQSSIQELNVSQSCSEVFFWPLLGFDNDSFIYTVESELNILSKGENEKMDLNQRVKSFYLNKNNEVVILWENLTISTYDNQLNLILESNVLKELYEGKSGNVYTINDNKIYIYIDRNLIIFDINTNKLIEEISLIPFETSYEFARYYYIENNMFLFSDNAILKLDLESYVISELFNGNKLKNSVEPLLSYRATGYFKFTYTEGITSISKIIDPITGLEVSSTQSEIVKDSWFVKPLN